jgi:hypothetical protein
LSAGAPAFPRLRWLGPAWLAVWLPAYLWQYGPAVFLNLCDVAVILTCVGLWTGSPLLLSSQALSSLVVDVAWNVDLAVRALFGVHLVGGTGYMWEPKYPLWLRLLSLFHVWLPIVLVWGLRKLGYDRRAFLAQSVLAAVVMAASRLLSNPADNQNFAFRDPFLGRTLGPAPVHVALTTAALVGLLYWPLHRLLAKKVRPPRSPPGA